MAATSGPRRNSIGSRRNRCPSRRAGRFATICADQASSSEPALMSSRHTPRPRGGPCRVVHPASSKACSTLETCGADQPECPASSETSIFTAGWRRMRSAMATLDADQDSVRALAGLFSSASLTTDKPGGTNSRTLPIASAQLASCLLKLTSAPGDRASLTTTRCRGHGAGTSAIAWRTSLGQPRGVQIDSSLWCTRDHAQLMSKVARAWCPGRSTRDIASSGSSARAACSMLVILFSCIVLFTASVNRYYRLNYTLFSMPLLRLQWPAHAKRCRGD